MSSFILYVPVAKSLNKIDIHRIGRQNNQIGQGNSVEIVSPTKQIFDQAKETLKRNKKEAVALGLPPTPGNIAPSSTSSPPGSTFKGKAPPKKKRQSKVLSPHERYKKI